MNHCSPSNATEITDLILNCKTQVLTIIQTAADGTETAVSTNLSCLLDGTNPVVDVRMDCDSSEIIIEYEDGSELKVDIACIDTFVTWEDWDNAFGMARLTSANGEETVDVMLACSELYEEHDIHEDDRLIMCKDGRAIKASVKNIIGNLELVAFEDGYGTNLEGKGTDLDPFKVNLNACELNGVNYDQQASLAVCSNEETVSMPAIRAGTGVIIQNSGRIDISFCDRPDKDYDVNDKKVVCNNGVTFLSPEIKPGDNVDIEGDGTLNVTLPDPCAAPSTNYNQNVDDLVCDGGVLKKQPVIKAGTGVTISPDGTISVVEAPPPLVFVNNGRPVKLWETGEIPVINLPVDFNINIAAHVPSSATGIIVRVYTEADTSIDGLHTPVEVSLLIDNNIVSGSETGGKTEGGDNSTWNDAIVPHTPSQVNARFILLYPTNPGSMNGLGTQTTGYLVGYFS